MVTNCSPEEEAKTITFLRRQLAYRTHSTFCHRMLDMVCLMDILRGKP